MSLKYNLVVIDKTNIKENLFKPILELFYTLKEDNICMNGQLGFAYILSRLNFLLEDHDIDETNTKEIVTNFIQYDEDGINNKLFIYFGYNSQDKTKGILSFAFISEYQDIVEVVLLCKQDSVPGLTDYDQTVSDRKLAGNKKTASASLITNILNTYGKNNKTVMLQPSIPVFEWYLQFNPTYFNIVGTESININFMIWFPILNQQYIHDMLLYINAYAQINGGEDLEFEESDVVNLTDIILKRIVEMTEFKTNCTSTSDKECNMEFIEKKVNKRDDVSLGGRKYKNLKQIKKTYKKNKKNKKKLKKTKKTKKIKYTFRK